MGYGATSKGGGGSGSAGGGKKKSGGKKQKPRTVKVKTEKTTEAAAAATTTPAFTVQEPNPEERARLLAARRRGEQLFTELNVRRRKPVNGGTSNNGRVLGGNSEDGVISTAPANNALDHPQGQQQVMQQSPFSERDKARQSFLATQEAKMENVRNRREKAAQAKKKAEEQQFAPKVALAKQQWDALAARLDVESITKTRHLLKVVLRNAATKSDPKYKLLKSSNQNLWTWLLRFQEVVAVLEIGAGFERRVVDGRTNEQIEIETEALRMDMERDRINVQISQALDESSSSSSSGSLNNNQNRIASLIADLDALQIAAATNQQQLVDAVCVADDDHNAAARDFELIHVGAGKDGLGVKRILCILRAVEMW